MIWNVCSKNYPLKQVSVSNLKNYLINRGWALERFGREEVLKFKSPQPLQGENYLEVLIPSKEQLFDYEQIVESAIESISAYEKQNFDDVLSQILSFGDTLKFQISTPKTKMGYIPMTDGINLYNSVSDLIVYSACAELTLKKSFPRKFAGAIDLIEKCQIGQSQYGSFIANIHCQLERPEFIDYDVEMKPIPSSPPLGRRTVLRILRGLENVRESIQIESTDPIVNNYHVGLNANMCDTLVKIIQIGIGTDIRISAALEPTWGSPNVNTDFILQPSTQPYLMEASDILKGENPEEEITIEGYVFYLRRIPIEAEENTIRILTSDLEEGEKSVTIKHLDEESYQKAISAHSSGNKIRITGILQKLERTWYLNRPQRLEIIG
jgi:hypothetical protein